MLTCFACIALLNAREATPEATVQAVIDAANQHNWQAVFSRFQGARTGSAVRFMSATSQSRPLPKLLLIKSDLVRQGSTCHGLVLLRLSNHSTAPFGLPPDDVRLVKEGGNWKIVGGANPSSFFSQLGSVARSSDADLRHRTVQAERKAALSKLKEFATAALLYASDHHEALALTQDTLKSALTPYLRDPDAYKGADGQSLDVRFNGKMTGRLLTQCAQPGRTVLFTIGSKASPVLFDGKAVVAFVDGHVMLVSKGDLLSFVW